ncbi:MAG: hypothetical protein AAGB46_15180 [Verrucomicrobiota bacterium]
MSWETYDFARAIQIFGVGIGWNHISYTIKDWLNLAGVTGSVALFGYVCSILLEFTDRILDWQLTKLLVRVRWHIAIASSLFTGAAIIIVNSIEPELNRKKFFDKLEHALAEEVISDCDQVIVYRTERRNDIQLAPPPPPDSESNQNPLEEMLKTHFNDHSFMGLGVVVDRGVMTNLIFDTDVYHHTYYGRWVDAGFLVRFVKGKRVLDLWINEGKDVWMYMNDFEELNDVLTFQRPYDELMLPVHGDAGSRLIEYGHSFYDGVEELYSESFLRANTMMGGG